MAKFGIDLAVEECALQAAAGVHSQFGDRHLQRLGYRVFRFTGSELYRNPVKCANEVWEWLTEGEP